MRSKQRVADHGEVFTPPGVVTSMIDLVGREADRVDSRFLESACGSGNFLVSVLQRKLTSVNTRYGKGDFERRHYALLAVMSLYGIEVLPDNVAECRENLQEVFAAWIGAGDVEGCRAARGVLDVNIVHGDAISMRTLGLKPRRISFAEWSYLGRGRYHRRDFSLETLTQMSSFSDEDTLFADLGAKDIFTPVRDHGQLTMAEIAEGVCDD